MRLTFSKHVHLGTRREFIVGLAIYATQVVDYRAGLNTIFHSRFINHDRLARDIRRGAVGQKFIRMVAELTDISTATVGGKASLHASGISKQRKRPKWIQTATREPIYSVLDSDDSARSLPPDLYGRVVIISAVKNEPRREVNAENKSPHVWPSSRNRTSPILEVEDENTLYSVVRKPKKVRLPETTSSDEETIRPVDPRRDSTRIEDTVSSEKRQLDPEDASKRVEVRKWFLRDTPRQPLPDSPKMFSDRSEYENRWSDRENSVALPRGVVGLVGPYRIYKNPNENREYMLQEEELVEEVLDSTSEKVQEGENKNEHRQRAKWKIREDDEETLVPDIRDLPNLEDFIEMKDDKREGDDWRDEQESVMKMEKMECVEKILSGKEERAVDVPDTISAVSMTSTKQKWGEKIYLTMIE